MFRYIPAQEIPRVGDLDPGTWFERVAKNRYRSMRHEGVTLEKRTRNPKDGCSDTGWYLYSPHRFGAWCARDIVAAVEEANRLLAEDEES